MFSEKITNEINFLIQTAMVIWGDNIKAPPLTECAPKRPWFKWEWTLYGKVHVQLEMDLGNLAIGIFHNGKYESLTELSNDEKMKNQVVKYYMDRPDDIRYRLQVLDRVAKDILWEME
jgi:hypothetical protein